MYILRIIVSIFYFVILNSSKTEKIKKTRAILLSSLYIAYLTLFGFELPTKINPDLF